MSSRPKEQRIILLDYLPKKSIGCEIGVWKGEFSELILKIVQPQKLYLIDPWIIQDKYVKRLYSPDKRNQTKIDSVRQCTYRKFANNEKVIILEGFSYDKMVEIPNAELYRWKP